MISIHEIILYTMVLLPISTLFVNQGVTNKILFFCSILAFSIVILKKLRKKQFLLLVLLVLNFIISLMISDTVQFYNLNDIFYLPQWILLFIYLGDNLDLLHNVVQKNIKLIKYCIYVWEILFIILRIVYPDMNEEFAHRSASAAFLIIAEIWFVSKELEEKSFNIHMIIPLAAVFLLEVRTYLIASMLIACMSYYLLFRRKRYFYLTIAPVALLTVYFILQTSIGSRFTDMTESYYGGVLATLTSSRSVFWEADIKAFMNSDLLHKFLGNGYNFIYDVNNSAVNALIWGHNDFIHIIVSNGIFGIIIYIMAFAGFLRNYIQTVLIDKRLLVMAIATLLFCALFDGLYHYTCALYAAPFLFDGLRKQSIVYQGETEYGDN